MVIQQTFYNHFRTLRIAIFTTVLLFLLWWYFDFKKDYLIILSIYHLIFIIPSFYLHISYYFKNKGTIAEILSDKIIIHKNQKETVIRSDEIKEIVVYKSASMDRGGIPITPMEAYFFVRIYNNSNKKYELTCLMDTNIDKTIKILQGVEIFREKGFFNMV